MREETREIDSLRGALAAMQQERDLAQTAAAEWREKLAHLTEERDVLRAKYDALATWSRDELAALTAAHARVRALAAGWLIGAQGYENTPAGQATLRHAKQLESALAPPEGPNSCRSIPT